MKIFLSAGEPSGDLHAANLASALRSLDPAVRLLGFGGDKMSAAGVDLLFPLTRLSIMWFSRSIVNLPKFFALADQAERVFRREKPDAVVLVDYPGFHWHLAKRAKAAGVPVYYFVPPQLWAWGGWRTRKMRKYFDTILTALPFEDDWFRKKGLTTRYVGHPYFDELAQQRPDAGFVSQARAAGPVVALLPGSRNQEVAANFPLMLAAADKLHRARPDARFLVASFNERQRAAAIALAGPEHRPMEFHVGKTAEIIASADVCLAVSGSVGLELMHRGVPSAIVYRYSRLAKIVSRQFITCKYISLVNLLANEELFPEFLTHRDCSSELAARLLGWLNNPVEADRARAKLRQLRDRVAVPGACERAARFLVERIAGADSSEVPPLRKIA
jgi:lipid-A-disaccharide synthase